MGTRSNCGAPANKGAGKSKNRREGVYVEHKSLGNRGSGLPDADGSWRSLRLERFPDSLARQFHWSIEEVTVTFTVSIFVLGIACFFGGLWLNRKGPRVVALTGGFLYGLGVFLASAGGPRLLARGGNACLYPTASQFPEERCDDRGPVVYRSNARLTLTLSVFFAVNRSRTNH